MLTIKHSNPREHAARRRIGMFEEHQGHLWPRVTIGMLPDDVLLEIFNFYLDQSGNIGAWHTLVHVCRQWRCVVFASPLRLNLRLLCRPKRPAAMALDTWPIIPIVVDFVARGTRPQGMRNIIAALKQHNRVCSINIQNIPNSLLKKFAVLRKPFPALTELKISSGFGVAPIVPDSFLGGSTPQLRTLQLDGIPFPALGNLLLSTSNLVDLDLQKIPHSGYVSPQVIVASLSSSIGLKKLALGFRSPQSWDDQANWDPPPLTRIVLPTLTRLMFKGDSQYLEAIVSRIDAPLLDSLEITFFNQLMFDTPLLGHFISRTETFTAVHRADVDFELSGVQIALVRRNETSDTKILTLLILCKQSDWQPSSIAQVCNSIIPPLPTLGKLRIGEGLFLQLQWYDDMENTEWLELLQPFTCVKDLVLSERLVPFVAPALQELDGERVTQMLPVLQDVFLEGSQPSGAVKEAMERFIAVRRLSGHPVTMRALDAELNSYPPDIMGEAKLRAGLGDRDAQSLTLEEKQSIIGHAIRLEQLLLPPNEEPPPNHKPQRKATPNSAWQQQQQQSHWEPTRRKVQRKPTPDSAWQQQQQQQRSHWQPQRRKVQHKPTPDSAWQQQQQQQRSHWQPLPRNEESPPDRKRQLKATPNSAWQQQWSQPQPQPHKAPQQQPQQPPIAPNGTFRQSGLLPVPRARNAWGMPMPGGQGPPNGFGGPQMYPMGMGPMTPIHAICPGMGHGPPLGVMNQQQIGLYPQGQYRPGW